MKKLRIILLALFLAIGLSGTGNAATMTDLLAGGSIQVGDKLFSDWSYDVIIDDAGLFDPIDAFNVNSIEVIGLGADPTNPGIRFQTVAGASSQFYVDDFNWLDVEFTFKVSVLDPLYLIDGVSLSYTGSMGADEGSVGIGDDIATDSGLFDPIDGGDVTGFDPWVGATDTPGVLSGSDSVAFDPLPEIWVKKDIALISWDGGSVEVDQIDQYFHQTPIPEPSTLLLLGVGLLGYCGVTRKKRA